MLYTNISAATDYPTRKHAAVASLLSMVSYFPSSTTPSRPSPEGSLACLVVGKSKRVGRNLLHWPMLCLFSLQATHGIWYHSSVQNLMRVNSLTYQSWGCPWPWPVPPPPTELRCKILRPEFVPFPQVRKSQCPLGTDRTFHHLRRNSRCPNLLFLHQHIEPYLGPMGISQCVTSTVFLICGVFSHVRL